MHYTVFQEKEGTKVTDSGNSSNLHWCSKFFHWLIQQLICSHMVIKDPTTFPWYPTLWHACLRKSPCSRTAWTNCQTGLKLPCKIYPLKIVVEKYSSIDVSILFADEKILTEQPALQNNWPYAAATTKKKASQQNPFAQHHHSVTVFAGVSWQVRNWSTPAW